MADEANTAAQPFLADSSMYPPPPTETATIVEISKQNVLLPATKKESWITKLWRPMMAWQYMAVCLFDFILAPIMMVIYSDRADVAYVAWHPLSLEGGGLYHLAMGAVLGITSWSRGQEKLKEMTLP